jgi:hypothetical protein
MNRPGGRQAEDRQPFEKARRIEGEATVGRLPRGRFAGEMRAALADAAGRLAPRASGWRGFSAYSDDP